jgi:serine/threonine protein phosphatase PrpC
MPSETTIWDHCLDRDGHSDVGMRRSQNQDQYEIDLASDEDSWRQRGHLFLVADGMGAHAAGELASEMAAKGIPHLFRKAKNLSAPEALQRAMIETNTEIHRRGKENEEFFNMGTTCCALTLLPQGAILAHVGDSRVYRMRGENLEQLTFDHSLVWEMREAGQLSENSALADVVPKNIITRSLGPNAVVKVDVEGPFPLQIGDTFMLCSDGLTGPVKDEEIACILASLKPKEAVRVLIDLANLRGGPDNITVVIAKVTAQDLASQPEGNDPITIGGETVERKIHPVLWALLGACFLAAAGMAVTQNWIPAGLAAVGGLVMLGVVLVKQLRVDSKGVSLTANQRFGRGPYTKTPFPKDGKFIETLADIVNQLREAALEGEWDVEWPPVDEKCRAAEQAYEKNNYSEAVRDYCLTVSYFMSQLRGKRNRKSSDSSVDLV